ncbi:MAG: SOS response-associated peptidase [Flavobacteriales bacterium]|nr:SOS response-associated peptidase [Flavobacteriales bacterium]
MCGRYVVITRVELVEKRFNVKATAPDLFAPDPNIGVGALAPVILNRSPRQLSLSRFGLTPSWAKKKMYLFNARAEGDHNPGDNPAYNGAVGIIEKPSFRKAIRSQRCLVVADAFVEGSKEEGLSKPWLVYLREEQRPFAMAGIWEDWTDPVTGAVTTGFAIVTAPANEVVQAIGHHRCPVILQPEQEKMWLDTTTPLKDITAMLHTPEASRMNAYPISPEIKRASQHDLSLLRPLGERIKPEFDFEITKHIELFGMGEMRSRNKRRKSDDNQLSLF